MNNLFSFVAVNYIDKMVGFLAVFLLAQLGAEIDQYNRLEYIYGVSVVLSVFLDLGIYKYLYYGHRGAGNQEAYLRRMLLAFCQLILLYLAVCFSLIWLSYYNSSLQELQFALVRISYLLALPFFIAYCRLTGSNVFSVLGLSVGCNLVALFYVSIASFQDNFSIKLFLLPQLAFCLVTTTILAGKEVFSSAWLFLVIKENHKAILRYSAPVMGGVFLTSLFNNYAKIASYNSLAELDTFDIMLSQRLSLLLLLTHGGVVSYLTKDIFDKSGSSDRQTMSLYFGIIIALAFGLLFSFWAASESSHLFSPGISNHLILYVFVGSSLLWCGGAFLEIFINREGKTYLSFFSVVSASIVTVGISRWYNQGTAVGLSLVPLTFSGIYLLQNVFLMVWTRNALAKT